MAESTTIDQVVDIIEKMTVMELSELSKTLQDKFGVSAAAPVMMGGPAAGGGGGEAVAEEKTEFTPFMTAVGDKKIQVIKVIREITGLGLKEAKELVDKAPGAVKEDVSKEEAESIQSKLQEVGAVVEIR
ncbi:MAG: 50S ribosomal protein L7/L12 [candidate division Zixibacteria bacterium]|nr:50S ribosomal protein L7/L12 [candidate division Zixibacteria bacterium]